MLSPPGALLSQLPPGAIPMTLDPEQLKALQQLHAMQGFQQHAADAAAAAGSADAAGHGLPPLPAGMHGFPALGGGAGPFALTGADARALLGHGLLQPPAAGPVEFTVGDRTVWAEDGASAPSVYALVRRWVLNDGGAAAEQPLATVSGAVESHCMCIRVCMRVRACCVGAFVSRSPHDLSPAFNVNASYPMRASTWNPTRIHRQHLPRRHLLPTAAAAAAAVPPRAPLL